MRAPEFWNELDYTAKAAVRVLAPASWIYGRSVAWKRDRTIAHRPRAKVVCIGNLTVGGTGKTPVAIAVARALAGRGSKPMILSRGYGGRMRGPALVDPVRDTAAETGDEALLLAAAAPVVVARDRRAGAALADAEGAQIIVMDDGHQNFALVKDLSIVVIDGAVGFGNGRVLPAGPLREPVTQGLERADAVIVVGDGSPGLPGFEGPVLRVKLTPVDVLGLKGARAVAFAGIGRPGKFFDSLRAMGSDLIETREYADHHAYTASEIARLKSKARASDGLLITTEKDFVRLTPPEREGVRFLPVRAAFDDAAALDSLLDRVAPPRAASGSL